MRRLYSSFSRGAPGAGLLLIRLAEALALTVDVDSAIRAANFHAQRPLHLMSMATALLLVAGAGTRAAGLAAAAIAFWYTRFGLTPDAGLHCALSFIGIAIALLGPGGWSVDAWLFGWKRLDIRSDHSNDQTPGDAADSRPL